MQKCEEEHILHSRMDDRLVKLLVLINVMMLAYICFRPSEKLDYGLGKWRESDVSLCFHLNEFYDSSAGNLVRRLNKLFVFAMVAFDLKRVFDVAESWSANVVPN